MRHKKLGRKLTVDAVATYRSQTPQTMTAAADKKASSHCRTTEAFQQY